MKHFINLKDVPAKDLRKILNDAKKRKTKRKKLNHLEVDKDAPLKNKLLVQMFEKSSLRTRLSFYLAIKQLGGSTLTLRPDELHLSRGGESIEDTAKVLSRFLDGLIIRTHGHELIEEFARHTSIPVVNALTDFLHPCQIYADCMTLLEKWSDGNTALEGLKGKKLAFFGDTSCNMANSWILAGALFGIEISLCGPESFQPGNEIQQLLKDNKLTPTWSFTSDPHAGAHEADAVYTDVWVSMGCEEESQGRLQAMQPYQVKDSTFESARQDCLFMHCMPAHPGEEVSESVLDSQRAILFDQAENRLHMQKAILSALSPHNS